MRSVLAFLCVEMMGLTNIVDGRLIDGYMHENENENENDQRIVTRTVTRTNCVNPFPSQPRFRFVSFRFVSFREYISFRFVVLVLVMHCTYLVRLRHDHLQVDEGA